MKIYIETDSVYSAVIFRDSDEEWNPTGLYDWGKLMTVLLTPEQFKKSMEKDFCGYVSLKRYTKAKELYKSLNP